MTSQHPSASDSFDEDGTNKNQIRAISIEVSLTGSDEMNKRFKACIKNDFPLCLDEALQVIFGTSEMDSVNEILKRARRTDSDNLQNITTPQGIWALYKRVIQEFQTEFGETKCMVIETESTNKMRLIHCQKCPLYEYELKRLQNALK